MWFWFYGIIGAIFGASAALILYVLWQVFRERWRLDLSN